jgi:cobalamin biosynthesis protein CobD/CbiB
MGFLALIFALLIDQGRNLTVRQLVIEQLESAADRLRRLSDMGGRYDGWRAWGLMMLLVSVLAVTLDGFAARTHVLFQFALHVVVLYLFIGFRQFSGPFSAIQRAFAEGDPSRAFVILQAWLRGRDLEDPAVLASGSATETFDSNAVCRQAIDHALIASHRHVFGPLLAYILLPGILGPVIYRVAEVLLNRWHHPAVDAGGESAALSIEDSDRHRMAAQQGFAWIDWVPVRLNAAGLTVVGNFEDAVFCWRGAVASRSSLALRQAEAAAAIDESRAILLATASGALNLRLADPALEGHWVSEGFEWQGALPDPSGLRSAVGLVWRNAVLWVSFFAILTMAGWLGR